MSAAAVRTRAIQSLRRQLLASQHSQSIQQILPTGLTSLDAIVAARRVARSVTH